MDVRLPYFVRKTEKKQKKYCFCVILSYTSVVFYIKRLKKMYQGKDILDILARSMIGADYRRRAASAGCLDGGSSQSEIDEGLPEAKGYALHLFPP